jgi:aminoglycoside phosphotransferase family enzyme/predicted kinase
MAGSFTRSREADAIVSDLARPDVYPGRPPSVEVHETHGSWVFVAGEDVLKIKRPVKLSFLDYSTLERRRAMCREEVRLNQRLAPRIYVRTVGIVPDPGGGLAMTADDEAQGVVEVGVLMRRYDESDILAARLAAGTATGEQLRAVGARIAAFHAASPRPDQAETALVTLRQAVRTTLDDLEAAPLAAPGRARVPILRNRLETLLASSREDLLARGRRGLVVDGHGDLRLQHVLLTDPVQVVDALEFDPGLRIADVACDIGFLVMDLEGEGPTALADALLTGYREAGGDPGDDGLLALMACYRALVRAKIDAMRGRDERAQERIAQATALGWRARGPMLLAVCGPPATGKSTLAAALCEQSVMVRVSSDVVRKARLGLGAMKRAPDSAYDRDATLRTYRALGEHAAAGMAAGRGAVIDATMGDAEARAAFRDGLGRAADSVVYVECRAPRAEIEARARARETVQVRESDATAAIAERLGARFAPLDEIQAARHRVLRTDRSVEEIVGDLTTWLDRAWG